MMVVLPSLVLASGHDHSTEAGWRFCGDVWRRCSRMYLGPSPNVLTTDRKNAQ
jgi:hypothetical protein